MNTAVDIAQVFLAPKEALVFNTCMRRNFEHLRDHVRLVLVAALFYISLVSGSNRIYS